jgi:hypothetical protein
MEGTCWTPNIFLAGSRLQKLAGAITYEKEKIT